MSDRTAADLEKIFALAKVHAHQGPHLLHFEMDETFHLHVVKVTCPGEDLGIERFCAVWASEDGATKEDACSVSEWVAAAGGWAEELGFRLPVGTWWIPAQNPLPVAHSFNDEYLSVWPWGMEQP